jgi:hypothetical protein
MSRDMSAADVRPATMRRPEMHPTAACPEAYSPAVPAKPAAVSAKASDVSATTMPTAPMSHAATMAAATASATAGVGFECEKRHDDEQDRRNASAGREYRRHGAAGLDARHSRGRLSLVVSQRTKSF